MKPQTQPEYSVVESEEMHHTERVLASISPILLDRIVEKSKRLSVGVSLLTGTLEEIQDLLHELEQSVVEQL